MSILSALYHGEIHDNPNAAHNIPAGQKPNPAQMDAESAAMGPQPVVISEEDPMDIFTLRQLASEQRPPHRLNHAQAQRTAGQLNCVGGARAAWQASLEGALRPGLYYTGQQGFADISGWVESSHTVESKLESKEEFPRG